MKLPPAVAPPPFTIWLQNVAIAKVRATLLRYDGSRTETARALGMHRQSINYWLNLAEKRAKARIAANFSLRPQ